MEILHLNSSGQFRLNSGTLRNMRAYTSFVDGVVEPTAHQYVYAITER